MNSIVAVGGLHFGTLLTQAEATNILYLGVDAGIDLIDTAPLYGAGNSESIIGKALEKISNSPRIKTKVGLLVTTNKYGQFSVKTSQLIKKNIQFYVDNSVSSLKIGRNDILTLHAFDSSTPLEETVSAVNELVKHGKIKSISCSNFNPDQLKKLIDCCGVTSTPIERAQVQHNPIDRRVENKFTKLCESSQRQIHSNRALARGALSNMYEDIPRGSRAHSSLRIKKWISAKRVNIISKKHNRSLVDATIMWFKKKNFAVRLRMGARNLEQFKEIPNTKTLKINNDLIEEIEVFLALFTSISFPPGRYFEK
jgi:aryl-alcohol dehydrogenase-like predicted oxidoreductase